MRSALNTVYSADSPAIMNIEFVTGSSLNGKTCTCAGEVGTSTDAVKIGLFYVTTGSDSSKTTACYVAPMEENKPLTDDGTTQLMAPEDCSEFLGASDSSYGTNRFVSYITSVKCTNLNTSKVTNMSYMFAMCGFTSSQGSTSIDVSSFDTSNVENMFGMFGTNSKLASLDLSSFNTSKVTNMASMFSICSSLSTLTLPKVSSSPVTTGAAWYVGGVTNMNKMFSNCTALNADYSAWNVNSSVTHENFNEYATGVTAPNWAS